MKWKVTAPPAIGHVRERRAFAWLPLKTGDAYTVWLESYGIHEEYRQTKQGVPAWCPVKTFSLVCYY